MTITGRLLGVCVACSFLVVWATGCAPEKHGLRKTVKQSVAKDDLRLRTGIEVNKPLFKKGEEIVLRVWVENDGPRDLVLNPPTPWWRLGLDLAQVQYFERLELTPEKRGRSSSAEEKPWLPNGAKSWIGSSPDGSFTDSSFWLCTGDTLAHVLRIRATRKGKYRAVFQLNSHGDYELVREPLDRDKLKKVAGAPFPMVRNPHRLLENTIGSYYSVWRGLTSPVSVEFEVTE